MITIHHLENSRSQRIIWLCEALGVDYEIKHYKRNPITQLAGKDFKQLHPLGKSPAISYEGKVYVESAAIFEFILDKFDVDNKFRPNKKAHNYQDHIFWMHFSEGSLMGPLLMRFMHKTVQEKVPFFIKPVAKVIFAGIEHAYLKDTIDSMFGFIEQTLSRSTFLNGENLSALDMMMSFPLEVSIAGRADTSKYPNIARYVELLKADSNYKAALEVGGPYKY
jgi:glutathione S-transferase